jgi:hypothetical protein
LEGSGCGLVLRHYPGLPLNGLRETTKKLSQDTQPPGRDLHPGPAEYKAGVLTARPRRSVFTEQVSCNQLFADNCSSRLLSGGNVWLVEFLSDCELGQHF